MTTRSIRFGALFTLAVILLGQSVTTRAQNYDPLPAFELKPAFPNLKVTRPLWLEEAPDGSKRLFVLEQAGRIIILPKDRAGDESKVFFDITDRKPLAQNEEGLLGMAFHPQFKTNGKFYVFYSQQNPMRSVISEFQVSKTDPDKADLASERILFEVSRPYWNHDGGALVFGNDGYLYISLGDGGLGRDPHNFGQNLHTLLAKILRIDVNSRTGDLQYGIPKDNPFVGQGGGVREEIWAYGLRNVWRMSIDHATGDLWAADVGQDKWEEVNLITKGGNYGWSIREAFHPFKDPVPEGVKLIDPIIEYGHNGELVKQSQFPDHSLGISITGGFVYRGKRLPSLQGVYVYGDYQFGTVWGLRYADGKLKARGTLVKSNPVRNISAFGQDLDGEIYVLAFDSKIYELFEAK